MNLAVAHAQPTPGATRACPLCSVVTPVSDLAEAAWQSPQVIERMVSSHPNWRKADGACPACLQQVLLETLLERGEAAMRHGIQHVWPLDSEAAFGALPTPLRMRADPRFSGRGVTLAVVDAGFYPHADLVRPVNRIRAWADASQDHMTARRFRRDEGPEWPGSNAKSAGQWHGLMTSCAAAGCGWLSQGLYRGLAPEADLVLVQVRDAHGRITNASITRALRWLRLNAATFGVRVVNLSLGGDLPSPLRGNDVDSEVAALVAEGVVVVVASGNDGVRRLVPPGTAPEAITVGGLDDRNTFDLAERQLWHSNYGETAGRVPKPEVVAPSLRVVAPLLPETDVAHEASRLFAARKSTDLPSADAVSEGRLAELKLVSPHYQHVEGTSFAAPIVAGIACCMLESNPHLTPRRIRELLAASALAVPGATEERQGAGAVDAGRAVAAAVADAQHGQGIDFRATPLVSDGTARFVLHDHQATEVRVLGSWDRWLRPGRPATLVEPGLWEAEVPLSSSGEYTYKFLLDGRRWICDPANPERVPDGEGGQNSAFFAALQS